MTLTGPRAQRTEGQLAEQQLTDQPFRVVGSSPAHHDFVQKVKGTLHYAADWQLPGMLYGRVVRSPLPNARIASIDAEQARALPGVVVVLTAADVPHNKIVERASGGLAELEVTMPVLASDRVRYVGEAVALVAAVTQQIADEAAELVDIDYQELPGVFDVESALADGAPLVHNVGNTLVSWQVRCGDTDAALAAADVVIEGEYRSQHVEHAYLEPEAGLGWLENDVLTLRVSTQVIEHAAMLARILGLPESKVRVIAAYMGGGFGGKEDMTVEPYLALLVWHSRRPVRMIWDRQESLTASTKRHPFIMRYRTGASRDGLITAQRVEILGDAGAYPNLSPRVLFAAAACACGPYRVPNASISSSAVFTNNVPASAFRGFGAMQIVLGYESQMDELAERLGISRTELRERNFLAKGDLLPTGEVLDTCVQASETMQRALRRLGEPAPPSGPGKLVGRGIGCNRHPYGRTIWFRDKASAWISVQGDGTVLIRSGITDLGAGQAASLCQIAAEVLGVPLNDISIYIGDSALNPPAGGTFATRQLYMSGNAVLHAARELRDQMAPVAADMLGAEADELEFAAGRVSRAGDTAGASITLAELAAACEQRAISTAHLSTWRAQAGAFDPRTGQGDTFPDYTYGTHAADVEVDVETGEVTVLKYAACHDVGRAINPMRVEGQIQGGAMQGLGYALTEDMAIEEGYPQAVLFANYLIPNSQDFPDVLVDIVESGEGKGPLGARGIGEPPIGNVAATIASAIQDAIGVRPAQLPMTPERVLALLRARAGRPAMTAPRASSQSRPVLPEPDVLVNQAAVARLPAAAAALSAPRAVHRKLPGYAVTPLVRCDDLAARLGVGELWVKDESWRLGLPAFKMLGASYACYRALAARLGHEPQWDSVTDLAAALAPLGPLTLCAATDGNHGRAVARMAALLGLQAVIYVPEDTAAARIQAIESEGATVSVVTGGYDAAVRRSAADASNTCLVISDTSWPGYAEIPGWVSQGYSTVFAEAADQLAQAGRGDADVVAVPVGVGALAAATVSHFKGGGAGRPPTILGVEPESARCVTESLRAGHLVTLPYPQTSIMAGLNCGTPSEVAWPLLQQGLDVMAAVSDGWAMAAMRDLAAAGIVAGETGAAALAGLLAITGSQAGHVTRAALQLGPSSRVLVLCTEGATDPAAWERVVGRPVPVR